MIDRCKAALYHWNSGHPNDEIVLDESNYSLGRNVGAAIYYLPAVKWGSTNSNN